MKQGMTRTAWVWLLALCMCGTGCGWEPGGEQQGPKEGPAAGTSSQVSPGAARTPSGTSPSRTRDLTPPQKRPSGRLHPQDWRETSNTRQAGFKNPIQGRGPVVLPTLPVRQPRWQRIGRELVPGGTTTGALEYARGLFVVGHYTDAMEVQGVRLTSAGKTDGFIAKFDTAGKLLWLKSFGGAGEDRIYGIAAGCRNEIYLAGQVSGELTVKGTKYKAKAKHDGFLASMSPITGQLNKLKLSRFEKPGHIHLLAVSHGTCDLVLGQQEGESVRDMTETLFSLRPTNWQVPRWTIPLGRPSNGAEKLVAMHVNAAGSVAVLGRVLRGGSFGPKHSVHGYHYFIASVSHKGEVNWVTNVDTGYQNKSRPVLAVADDGIVYVAGASSSGIRVGKESINDYSFVAAIKESGKVDWLVSLGPQVTPRALLIEKSQVLILARLTQKVTLGTDTLAPPRGQSSAHVLAILSTRGDITGGKYIAAQFGHTNEGLLTTTLQRLADGGFLIATNITGQVRAESFGSYAAKGAFALLKITEEAKVQWVKASGNGNSKVQLRDAAIDAKGNIYRVLSFAGKLQVGRILLDSKRGMRHAILKQNPQGRLLWSQFLDVVPHRLSVGARHNTGMVVVAGPLTGCKDIGNVELCTKGGNGFVASWTDNGVFRSAKVLRAKGEKHETTTPYIDDVVQNRAGSIYVALRTRDNKAIISKWDIDLQVSKEIPFGGATYSRTVLAIGPSDVYLMGSARAARLVFGKIELLTRGSSSRTRIHTGYVARLDPGDRFVWAKSYWDDAYYDQRDIHITKKGLITIIGTFQGSATFGLRSFTSPAYNTDGFVAQLNPQGDAMWAFRFTGFSTDPRDRYYQRSVSGGILTSDDQGNVYFGGNFRAGLHIGSLSLKGNKAGAAFLAKLDPKGQLKWAKSTSASLQKIHATGPNLLLIGHASGESWSLGQETYKLPNNNNDFFATVPQN